MSWAVNDAAVTHERLDDEVIAIALETGVYYSLRGVAADCWTVVAQGAEVDGIVGVIVERFDVGEETARRDIEAVLRDLEAEGVLVSGATASATAGAPVLPSLAERLPYAAPSFERFDDMRELLLLDPIHEVDAAGWPVPLAESA